MIDTCTIWLWEIPDKHQLHKEFRPVNISVVQCKMLLTSDLKFSPDLVLDLIAKFQKDDHVEDEDLNCFKEDENLESVSENELLKRLEKSFEINLGFIEAIVKNKLKHPDLVRLAHFAIQIANEHFAQKKTQKRAVPADKEKPDCPKAKKQKSDEPTVSCFLNYNYF